MNQIETTVAKAAWGRGWTHGLAEDCGRAAAWLTARGFDGISAALAAIEPGPLEPVVDEQEGVLSFHAAKAMRAAPSAFDVLAADAGLKRVVLRTIDQPLLLIGFGGIAARSYACSYRIKFADTCEVIVDGSRADITGILPAPGIDATIEAYPAKRTMTVPVPMDMEIEDRLWHDALAMAARSYVPSSASSRKFGAGAGLVDDD